MGSPNGHAILAASAAYRWMNCPGSVRLCAGIPSTSSVYAEEGTAAHALAQTCLTEGVNAAPKIGRIIRLLGEGHSILKRGAESKEGDFEITEEMAEAVQLYLDTIREDRKKANPTPDLKIEHKFDLSSVYPGMFGTNDACLVQPWQKLRIYDLKYGAGYAVEVENNPQLMYYALGASLLSDFESVEIVIVQPRARHKDGPVRRWGLSIQELEKWAQEELIPAARATENGARVVPGKWCRFCPALSSCGEFAKQAMEVSKSDFTVIKPPDPATLSEAELVRVLDFWELLKAWGTACFSHAEDILKAGGTLPGWKLVRKKTNRKWRDEAAVVKTLQPYGKKIVLFEQKLRSVKQIEDAVKMQKLQGEIDLLELIEKPEGALTLAPESDRREAVEISTATDFVMIDAPESAGAESFL